VILLFSFSVFFLVLVLLEKIHQTLKKVFGHILKSTATFVKLLRIVSSILGVWNSCQSQSFIFDVVVIVSFIISRYTSKNATVYAITLQWPFTGVLTLRAPISTLSTQVTMLGYQGKFAWKPATNKGGLIVTVPCIPTNKLKSKWVWVFKLEYVH